MWQFIISGYIPGTDIQITFETLLTFSLSVIATYTLFELIQKRHSAEKELIALSAKIKHIREISL